MEYYQKYFNADTNEVLMKLAGSITPTFNNNFLINRIRPNPDMYGPFWIITTLIFTIAITGNIASFLRNFGSDFKWHTDFHKGKQKPASNRLLKFIFKEFLGDLKKKVVQSKPPGIY